jgi:hypothetical protein
VRLMPHRQKGLRQGLVFGTRSLSDIRMVRVE